jgi:hypothetical protein
MKIVKSVADIPNEELCALYERWMAACPPGLIPEKALMQSTKIKGEVAENCKFVSWDEDARMRYDHVGGAVQKLYDQPMVGRYVDELFDPWIRSTVIKTYETAAQSAVVVYERKGFSTVFGSIGYEYLVLPFVGENGVVDSLLSCVFTLNKDLQQFSDWQKKISLTPWLQGGN